MEGRKLREGLDRYACRGDDKADPDMVTPQEIPGVKLYYLFVIVLVKECMNPKLNLASRSVKTFLFFRDGSLVL